MSLWRVAGYTLVFVPLVWFVKSRLQDDAWHSSSLLMALFAFFGFECGVRAGRDGG